MENVNHPNHYLREGRKECIIEMEEKFGKQAVAMFCLLNAYKYAYRAGFKEGNSQEQDIQKLKWYWNRANSYIGSDNVYKDCWQLKYKIEKEIWEVLQG